MREPGHKLPAFHLPPNQINTAKMRAEVEPGSVVILSEEKYLLLLDAIDHHLKACTDYRLALRTAREIMKEHGIA